MLWGRIGIRGGAMSLMQEAISRWKSTFFGSDFMRFTSLYLVQNCKKRDTRATMSAIMEMPRDILEISDVAMRSFLSCIMSMFMELKLSETFPKVWKIIFCPLKLCDGIYLQVFRPLFLNPLPSRKQKRAFASGLSWNHPVDSQAIGKPGIQYSESLC